MANYRTKPAATKGMPTGIPYIIGNEAAERFSFYGMKAVLVIFMVEHLLGADGALATMSESRAKFWTHFFVFAVYFTPLLGSLLSDVFWGKYRTIMVLSVVYCLGHFALALNETRVGLMLGLGLIALGAGGIKPCVSAHVGDQFGKSNQFRLTSVFAWFYFSINAGAMIAQSLTPKLLVNVGPWAAFGLPGVLMVLATIMFWLGRNSFVHIPAAGWHHFKKDFVEHGWSIVRRLGLLYFFGVSMFWALFDQTATAWVLQAKHMNRNVFSVELEPGQLLAVNPFLILVFIPLFNYVIYPIAGRFVRITPLRKMGTGLFLAVTSFVVCAMIESRIETGLTPTIWWQVGAYVLLTAAEILVSITALEFAYTQAPNRLKSVVMCLYLVSVAIGNLLPMAVNFFMENPDGSTRLTGVQYYLFFVFAMLAAAVLFVILARKYLPRDFVQDEDDEHPKADMEAEVEMR
ncbi:MAG: POT family MFS transporter [Verrucomicrobiae bacterium]|nr:POT family MFS transporter [Verrucomicrobiae bacterium]